MPVFDAHMLLAIMGIAVLGGLIGLDRTAMCQCMISQPIVAGPFVGWLLGDPIAGVVIGAVLELIWVLDMPVGAFVPANSTVSAITATAIAALGSEGPASLPVIGFSLLFTTAIARITMQADNAIRKWNAHLGVAAQAGPGKDVGRALSRAHLFGLAVFFFKSFALYLVFLPLGIGAVLVFNQMPEPFHRAMAFFVKLLPLLGVAIIARKLSMKTLDVFLLGGFLIAALMGLLFHAHALIIVLLTIMGGWLGARYRELPR